MELGWPGIAIAEDDGGHGLGMVELVVLLEESGYACAPTALLGKRRRRARHLRRRLGRAACRVAAQTRLGGGHRLVRRIRRRHQHALLRPPGSRRGGHVRRRGALLAPASEVEFEPFDAIDATRSFALVSDAAGERLPGDVDGGRDRLAVAIAAELTGIAQRALEMAVDYARERQQFGRPIGAYQAVGHRCAGMLLATEESRSLTYYAAWAADAEPESLPMAAAMAAARAADAGWQVPASALQVFGGIGFTWEHDLQFWLKRGRVEGRMLGTPRDHRERVADLSGLGAGEPRSPNQPPPPAPRCSRRRRGRGAAGIGA